VKRSLSLTNILLYVKRRFPFFELKDPSRIFLAVLETKLYRIQNSETILVGDFFLQYFLLYLSYSSHRFSGL
jgi:hypothetical protein